MKLEDYRQTYYEMTGKASDIARQVSFAGIALIWLFRDENNGTLGVPEALFLPAALLVSALFLDLLQYLLSALIWGVFARHHEKRGKKPQSELTAPSWFNWPTLALFWAKQALVLAAYVLIFTHILSVPDTVNI